jgi:ribosomal protein S18 acetylase RimI-like enzyme
MQYELAVATHLPIISRLMWAARHVHRSIADEDLPNLLQNGIGVLAMAASTVEPLPVGFAGVSVEARPSTLPHSAATRARLQVVALQRHHWPSDVLPGLLDDIVARLVRWDQPLQISVLTNQGWLERVLLTSGFALVDRVIVLRLQRLQRQLNGRSPVAQPALLRAATFGDTAQLAVLDADAFDSLWHFSAADMIEMLMRGRLLVAERDGAIAGYSALLRNSAEEMQLARLAVHPQYQRAGIGRQLLYDAIHYAADHGCSALVLNTQTSNQRSLALYRAAGFRPMDERVSVLIRSVGE